MKEYTTVSRMKINEYLEKNADKTVSAQDIITYLKECKLDINPSTVYRYLDKLVGENRVIKYTAKDSMVCVYQYIEKDKKCSEHLHLKCVRCGKIAHLECEFMDEISKHVMEDHGFEIQCKNSVIYGICADCRK